MTKAPNPEKEVNLLISIPQNGHGGTEYKLGNEIMNLKEYASYFHDGSIIEISHSMNTITIIMENAEIDREEIKDDVVLSKDNRIRGKLHIEGLKSVKENGQPFHGIVKMKHEDAEIFHFEINRNKVELQIKWCSYPPRPYIEDFSTIEIEAEKIWWENIPDLENFV